MQQGYIRASIMNAVRDCYIYNDLFQNLFKYFTTIGTLTTGK